MAYANIDLVDGRKEKMRKTRNELRKGSETNNDSDEPNTVDAVKRLVWRKATENRCNTGNLIG
jgi:hypothetical protein